MKVASDNRSIGRYHTDGRNVSPNAETDPVVIDPGRFDPLRPIARELQTSVGDGFVLSAAGDCVISRPMAQEAQRDPPFAQMLEVLKDCTTLFGNMETVAFDPRSFRGAPYAWDGDWPLVCAPAAVADLARMGFTLMGRANNHALDWGIEGMRESGRLLDAAGIAHAGCGETAGLARQAQYVETRYGRVGLVSCVSTFRDTTDALDQRGAAPGRPGVSGLAVTRTTQLPAPLLATATALAGELGRLGVAGGLGPFAPGAAASYHYEMDAVDELAILRQVRQGKEYSDLLVVALHAHEAADDRFPELPGDFVRAFAHDAIDAGAGVVITTGIHHLGPIEVYRGCPVFHGLGNFFWSDIQEPVPQDLYEGNRDDLAAAFRYPEKATDADLTLMLNFPSFANEETFLSIVPRMRFAGGRVAEIKLYPVDLGYGRRLTESGTPRLASMAAANRILARLSSISAPYGTKLGSVHERGTTVGTVLL